VGGCHPAPLEAGGVGAVPRGGGQPPTSLRPALPGLGPAPPYPAPPQLPPSCVRFRSSRPSGACDVFPSQDCAPAQAYCSIDFWTKFPHRHGIIVINVERRSHWIRQTMNPLVRGRLTAANALYDSPKYWEDDKTSSTSSKTSLTTRTQHMEITSNK
jgi:hypothetical protein